MKKITHLILPFILLIVGLFLTPVSIFELDFSKIPGDFGDARFNNYILEHDFQFFSGNISSYWNGLFMYPYQNNISFSDNLLGTAPIYSLFRLFDFSRETSFQLWILSMFLLNYIFSYWSLKKWSNNTVLSAVGAYIFAFSILLVGNIYNVQTLPRFIVPLLFYWTWMYFKDKKITYLYGLSLGLTYQFYCGIYLGFFTFYVLLFFAIAYFVFVRDKSFLLQFKDKMKVLTTLLPIILALLFLAPLMLPYYENSKLNGVRTFEEVISTIPTIQSYFFTSDAPILWQFLSNHGKSLDLYWCHFLFIGILPWISILFVPFVLFSKKCNNKILIKILVLGLALSMFFTLNFITWTPYKLIYYLPGFSSMRSINRIINTEIFFFVLILVFVFKELIAFNEKYKKLIFLLPLLVIADNLIYSEKIMRFDKQESINEIEKVKNDIISQNTAKLSVIAYLPLNNIDNQNIKIHLNTMLACQDLNLNCINAYTGSYPNGFVDFWLKMNTASLNDWLKLNNLEKKNVKIINDLGVDVKERIAFSLKSIEIEKYVCVDQSMNNEIVVNREGSYDWETFNFILLNDSMGYIQSNNNKFFVCDESSELIRSSDNFNLKDVFKIIPIQGDTVVLKAGNNKYLSINGKFLIANNESISLSAKFIFNKK